MLVDTRRSGPNPVRSVRSRSRTDRNPSIRRFVYEIVFIIITCTPLCRQEKDTVDVEQGFPDRRVVRPGVVGREQDGRRDEHHEGRGQAARPDGRRDRFVESVVHQDGAGGFLAGRRPGHVRGAHLPQTVGRRRGHVLLAGAPAHHARRECSN